MRLRSRNSSSRGAGPRLRAALLAGVLAALVTVGASSAGVGNYSSPLYLSGGPSSVVTGSYQLLTSAGPSVSTTPTATLNGAGVVTGTYSYIYTASSGGTITASPASTSIAASSNQITVGNLPSGTDVAIYRQKWAQAAGTNSPYTYVANSGGG